MHSSLLQMLRCPFCGSTLSTVENHALRLEGDEIEEGVLGCACCAFPVVAGIPLLFADAPTRAAMHTLETRGGDEALCALLGVAEPGSRRERLRALMRRDDATCREALELLCDEAEGTWCLHRFSDPTYVTAEALLQGIAQASWPLRGAVLDVCGGAGHLARVLLELAHPEAPRPPTVLADVYFWKLWLARRFNVPGAAPVCCDANSPLPFARDSFSTVLLADAFPYIWHKRLLADEMVRLAGADGLVVMPHLHSALGENHSAGDTLTPAAYRELFAGHGPRLFSDAAMFDDVIERRVVDLTRDASPDELGDEPSVTLVASLREDVFARFDLGRPREVKGELVVNPLYDVRSDGETSELTLTFPTPEYEAEFAASRRYLPDRITVAADLSGPVDRERIGAAYGELRDRRVLIDAPVGYCPAAGARQAGRQRP